MTTTVDRHHRTVRATELTAALALHYGLARLLARAVSAATSAEDRQLVPRPRDAR